MIVCDNCKQPEKGVECFECSIDLTKKEHNKSKKSVRPRKVISIPIHLCNKCVSLVCKNLGHFSKEMRDSE